MIHDLLFLKCSPHAEKLKLVTRESELNIL